MRTFSAVVCLCFLASHDALGQGRETLFPEEPLDLEACVTEPTAPGTLLQWAGTNPSPVDKSGPLVSDRPDFTEASTTVGRGRIQLEAGYTYFLDNADGTRMEFHSYPETLFRIGLFADWFELRLFPNFGSASLSRGGVRVASVSGPTDMQIGVKIALTQQAGWRPETAVIFQANVPTGIAEFTSESFDPGMNVLYSWEVVPDFLTFGGSTQANQVVDVFGHGYTEYAQSLVMGLGLTEKLGAYAETFAFFPHSAVSPGVVPAYFFDGGFTYLITDNFQLDIRAGVGLNDAAEDFFAGSGFVIRY